MNLSKIYNGSVQTLKDFQRSLEIKIEQLEIQLLKAPRNRDQIKEFMRSHLIECILLINSVKFQDLVAIESNDESAVRINSETLYDLFPNNDQANGLFADITEMNVWDLSLPCIEIKTSRGKLHILIMDEEMFYEDHFEYERHVKVRSNFVFLAKILEEMIKLEPDYYYNEHKEYQASFETYTEESSEMNNAIYNDYDTE